MLATVVSFEYERSRKNNGTTTALTADTHHLRAHDLARTRPSCREPRLANRSHAPSQRLCGITRTTHGDGTYICARNTVNVFETGTTLPGRSEVSLAATTPWRLQLCAV